MGTVVLRNPQSRLFFVYLVVLLAALLGQDVLLEPFGAQAFGLSVESTTRITAIWGTCMLIALLVAGWLQGRLSKRAVAEIGAWAALIAFLAIGVSGFIVSTSLFYAGVVALGVGTGLSTVANLSLMLDMTTSENVGLFIGAWGMANAISRLIGQLMSGVVRDVLSALVSSPAFGYIVVFGIEAAFLALSLLMLRAINVAAFQQQARSVPTDLVEHTALMSDALGN
jgi:BCD family chlorophyll transporter-like MFS transporter